MECRLCWVDGRPAGVPPRQMRSAAIAGAVERETAGGLRQGERFCVAVAWRLAYRFE